MKALKQIFAYAVSVALMRGISLIMLPIIARFLSPSQMGSIEILSIFAIFGSIMVSGGLEGALFRFAGTESAANAKKIAASIYMFAWALGLFFLFLSLPFSSLIAGVLPGDKNIYCVQLVLAIVCLESVIAVPLGYLRMTDHCYQFCIANIARVALHSGFTIYFLSTGGGIEGVFEACLIAAGAQAALLGYWHVRSLGVVIQRALIKPIFVYSIPIVGSGLFAVCLNGIDRLSIATYHDLNSVALYAIALKFALTLSILMQPFAMWWMPKRFAVLAQPDGLNVSTQYSTVGLVLLAYIMLAAGLIAPVLIDLTMPDFYRDSIPIFFALLLMMAIKETSDIINVGCFTGDKTYTQLSINTVTMVAGGIAVFFAAMLYTLWAVVIVLVLAHALRCAAFYYFSQKNVALSHPKVQIICLYAGVMSFITLFHLRYLNADLWYSSRFIIIALCLLSLLFIGSCSVSICKRIGIVPSMALPFKRFKQFTQRGMS